jgi:hypothetical protein
MYCTMLLYVLLCTDEAGPNSHQQRVLLQVLLPSIASITVSITAAATAAAVYLLLLFTCCCCCCWCYKTITATAGAAAVSTVTLLLMLLLRTSPAQPLSLSLVCLLCACSEVSQNSRKQRVLSKVCLLSLCCALILSMQTTALQGARLKAACATPQTVVFDVPGR